MTTGWVSASSVVSHTEPVHTPWAPERHGRRHLAAPGDAAGGQHRAGRHGVDDLGDEHHGGDLAGVAAGLVALGHDDVDAGGHVALGVLALAGQGGDGDVRRRGPP